jgi:hypothetical protein
MQVIQDSLDLSQISTLDDLAVSVDNPEGYVVYLYDITPNGKLSVCTPFKNRIPLEQDIVTTYGGGNYEALVKHKAPGKPIELIKSFRFNYEGAKRNRAASSTEQHLDGDKNKLDVNKLEINTNGKPAGGLFENLKELVSIIELVERLRGNKNEGLNLKDIITLQDRYNQQIIELIKTNGQNSNSELEKIALSLIKEKANPFAELKQAKEVIELLQGEGSGAAASSDPITAAIEKGLPLITSLIETKKQEETNRMYNINGNDLKLIAKSLTEYIKHISRTETDRLLTEYGLIVDETEPEPPEAEKKRTEKPAEPLIEPETMKHPNQDPNPSISDLNANLDNIEIPEDKMKLNPIQKAIINQIKDAPRVQQNEILRQQIKIHGYANTLGFCLGDGVTFLVQDEQEFRSRCIEAGIELPDNTP